MPEPTAFVVGWMLILASALQPTRRIIQRIYAAYYRLTWPVSGRPVARTFRADEDSTRQRLISQAPRFVAFVGLTLVVVGLFAK
jgi:hypothetical protein